MSKKDLAFELFDQGKTRKDPEVLRLGLKEKSLKKYYSQWKQPQVAPVVAPPSEVQLGSLSVGAKFEFGSEKYRVADKIEDSIVVDKFRVVTSDEETVWLHLAHLTLSPLVLVSPIK